MIKHDLAGFFPGSGPAAARNALPFGRISLGFSEEILSMAGPEQSDATFLSYAPLES